MHRDGLTGGADLHLHSRVSDGSAEPEELVRLAAAAGLEAIALTDHDTMDGVSRARTEAARLGLRFLGGCEISVEVEGQDVHLLAYGVDEEDETLRAYLAGQGEERQRRVRAILERLSGLGIRLGLEAVLRQAHAASSVGRMHVAQALVEEGWVSSTREAFARYLGDGKPAHVGRETVSLAETVEMVVGAGGCVVLAHPGLYDLDPLLPQLELPGFVGLEAYHPSHTEETVARLEALAHARGWIVTGGSDYHGEESSTLGEPRVSLEVVDALERRVRA
jgi:hypothetical protein